MTDQILAEDKNSILFASRASQLIQDKKLNDALSLCEAGVRQFPFYSPGHYILGLCYEALGKEEDAKNEFERTLVYDPSHHKAMRKLSNFYSKTGLDQLSNELLIKEALYSPLNPEIISILKEKNIYDQLNPADEVIQDVIEEVTTEVEIEKEINMADESIESIEEIEEPVIDEKLPEQEQPSEEASIEKDTFDQQEELIQEEEVVQEEPALKEETATPEEEENATIDDLDPLAGEDLDEDDELIIDNPKSSFDDDMMDEIEEEEDFSPLMQGYLESEEADDDEDEDQWMEVENLLDNDDDKISESDVDPVPDGPKDETEMLLEQLSSDDHINLEAAVVDPYDNIDLTTDVDKKVLDPDDLDTLDLAAAVNDPLEKKEEIALQETTDEFSDEDGETIGDIISEFSQEEKSILEHETEFEDEETIADSDEAPVMEEIEEYVSEDIQNSDEIYASDNETITADEQDDTSDDTDEEVTISDMLENPNLVTPTFGEILIAQHKFSEARHVFVELAKKEPENTRFMKKIQFLDKFLEAQ
jgi:tetratricopeptide (TPR) repeat protein